MSANTTPDGITYPTGTDAIAPLHTVFAVMASTVQTAFNNRTWVKTVADLNALAALTAMPTGAQAVVNDGCGVFQYSGTIWFQVDGGRFGTTALRDTAFAKASGVYLVTGVQCITSDAINRSWIYSTYGPGWASSGVIFNGVPAAPAASVSAAIYSSLTVPSQNTVYEVEGVITFDVSTSTNVRYTIDIFQPGVGTRASIPIQLGTNFAGSFPIKWVGAVGATAFVFQVRVTCSAISGVQNISAGAFTARPFQVAV